MEMFADNITLYASGYDELQLMLDEITQVIHGLKLKWKPGKPKDGVCRGPNCMVAGALRKEGKDRKVYVETSVGKQPLEWVDKLVVLGSLITAEGNDVEALQ